MQLKKRSGLVACAEYAEDGRVGGGLAATRNYATHAVRDMYMYTYVLRVGVLLEKPLRGGTSKFYGIIMNHR